LNFKRQLRNGLFFVLNHSLNPVTRRLARTSVGPFSLVRHVGRRSGKVYETPIMVSPVEDGFVIELTYGYDVDWHKNVVAAGSCTLVHHGREYAINEIEPMEAEAGRATFPQPARLILRILGKNDYEKFKVQK
jgi:deazaflavin-dependent oxidoreductase (nitroreductase family)